MNPLPGDIFAHRLRQERERLGVSQAELARRIAELLGTNIDPSAVTRIEQQTRAVRLDEAVAAAAALGLPLAALLSDDVMAHNEDEIQQYLAELALAEQRWEKDRQEIHRLTRTIQNLSVHRATLHRVGVADTSTDTDDTASAMPSPDQPAPEPQLDSRLQAAIDARVPLEVVPSDREVTDPDA